MSRTSVEQLAATSEATAETALAERLELDPRPPQAVADRGHVAPARELERTRPAPLDLGLGLDMRAALQLLLRKAKFIVAMTGIAMLAGVAVTMLSSPEYTAKVALLPTAPADGLGALGMAPFANFASNLGLGPGGAGIAVAFPDIIRSRQVRERVLVQEYETERFGVVALDAYLTDPGKEVPMRRARALRELEKRVRVSVDKLSGVLQVAVTMPEAKLSAQVTEAFVAELVQVESALQQDEARGNRQFIEQRLVETTAALEHAENQLTDFREHNLRIGNDPELLLQGERLAREAEIQKNVYITLTQQHELAKIEESRRGAGVQVIDPAKEPFSRSSPILLKNLVLGAFFGGAGACLLVVAQAWWRAARAPGALQRA